MKDSSVRRGMHDSGCSSSYQGWSLKVFTLVRSSTKVVKISHKFMCIRKYQLHTWLEMSYSFISTILVSIIWTCFVVFLNIKLTKLLLKFRYFDSRGCWLNYQSHLLNSAKVDHLAIKNLAVPAGLSMVADSGLQYAASESVGVLLTSFGRLIFIPRPCFRAVGKIENWF
jgi:hypothetical protein